MKNLSKKLLYRLDNLRQNLNDFIKYKQTVEQRIKRLEDKVETLNTYIKLLDIKCRIKYEKE